MTETCQPKRCRFSAVCLLTIVCLPDAHHAAHADSGGAISGVVTFDGPRPVPRQISMKDRDGKLSDCHQLHERGLLDEDLIVSADSRLANVFVYVKEGYEKKKYPAPKQPAVLNQKGCMFRPRVQGVMLGQDFVMKNDDPVLHNVRTLSFRNRPFNVAQPAKSPDRTKVFTRKEKAAMIQCDLHPWMKAWYFVMDHPWFAVTDEKGQFGIDGLPAGDYTLTAWHEELGEADIEVTVGGAGSSSVKFSFKPRKSNVIFAKVTNASPSNPPPIVPGTRPTRPFVRKWSVKDLARDVTDLTQRSTQHGQEVFNTAGCIRCHAIAGKGVKFGLNLTDVSKRFTGQKLLTQMLKPSVEIHKEFQPYMFITIEGKVIAGLIVKDEPDAIHVRSNPLRPEEIVIIPRSSIEERRKSSVSIMPEGLLDTFTREEILDLVAFVQSGGKLKE